MNFDKMTDDDILLEDDADVLSENYNDTSTEDDNDSLIEDDKDVLLEDDGDKPYTISEAYTAGDAELDLEDEEDYSPESRVPKQEIGRAHV